MMKLPSTSTISKEILVQFIAVVVVAFVIAKSDRLKKLVKEYSL